MILAKWLWFSHGLVTEFVIYFFETIVLANLRKNVSSTVGIFPQIIEVEKGSKEKVFEAEAIDRGWEMFPEIPIFSTEASECLRVTFFLPR